MKLSLVIPMYNEEEIVLDTARQLKEGLDRFLKDDYEIIFSDDGSTDSSVEKLLSLDIPCVRVLKGEKNCGKGSAVRKGALVAKGDYVMFTDCDLAYGVDIVEFALNEAEKNQEKGMLVGSRRLAKDGYTGYSLSRKMISKASLSFLSFIAGGLPVSDSQTGCKIFKRETVEKIFPLCEVDRFAFDLEIILFAKNMGIDIGEFPVTIINNRPSSIHFVKDSLRMIRDVIKMKGRIKKKIRENVNQECKA